MKFWFLLLFLLFSSTSHGQEFLYEEHATLKQIFDYMSSIKIRKDVEILNIPLKNKEYWLQDFMKSKEDQFFTIYNHNKSNNILLKEISHEFNENATNKLAYPFTSAINSINLIPFRKIEDIDFYQEISFLNFLNVKEKVSFHLNEEMTLFQIEDFYIEDGVLNMNEILTYIKSLQENRLSLFSLVILEIEDPIRYFF